MKVILSIQSLVISVLLGCSTSVEVKNFKPAQNPQGVHMELKLNGNVIDGNKISGELLAVRDDGVLVNVDDYLGSGEATNTVVLIPFWMMDTAKLEQMGSAKVESQGEEKNRLYLDRLRLVSRYPQGLSDNLLSVLLSSMGQDQVEVPSREE